MCKHIIEELIDEKSGILPLFARHEIGNCITNCKGKIVGCDKKIAKILGDVKNNHLRRSIIARWS